MRILVAGGSGFVGSNLCERLLSDGHDVLCIDNLLTGRRSNVERLMDSSAFTFIESDVIQKLPELPAVDRVYHLASPASPPAFRRFPVETLRVNSEGTRRLLDLCRRDGARFLYVSSSEVYGDPQEHPQSEDYLGNVDPIGPRSMYDEAKRYGEAITKAYSPSVNTRIIRLFNTYGQRSDPADGRMVPNFVTQALRGEAMTIYGDGQHTRSLCYISDTIDGLILAMESDRTRGEVLNLGNPEERQVREYAELVRRHVGSETPFIFIDQSFDHDPQRRRPNIDKARALLGWEPQVPFEAGLEETIAYFRNELARAAPALERADLP